MEETPIKESKVETKEISLKKISNKEFKKLFGPKLFWNSRTSGTYSIGKNEAKRKKKQKV